MVSQAGMCGRDETRRLLRELLANWWGWLIEGWRGRRVRGRGGVSNLLLLREMSKEGGRGGVDVEAAKGLVE